MRDLPFGSPERAEPTPESEALSLAYIEALEQYDAEQRVCDSFVPSALAEDEFCADCGWNEPSHVGSQDEDPNSPAYAYDDLDALQADSGSTEGAR